MGNGITATALKRVADLIPPNDARYIAFAPDPGGGGLQILEEDKPVGTLSWDGTCRITAENSRAFALFGQLDLAGATGQGSQITNRR